KAKNSNYSAKYYLYKKVKALRNYLDLSKVTKVDFLTNKEKRLIEKRFTKKRSS
ncbi:hypothetical protein J3E71DRAFT_187306, partial [Bipolaris maydis]